jgi:pimeloyl-ACP methyl ester carboxylesterase
VLSYLYFPEADYPKLREALNQLVNENNAEPLAKLSDVRSGRQADGHYRYNSFDSYFSVTCLDRQSKQTTNQVAALAKAWAKMSPTFGENLAWGILPCSNWPVAAPGPANVKVASSVTPILIVSRTRDPATPLQWAKNLQQKIPNSELVTWDSQGHTAYHQGSSCIDLAVDTYLLQGKLPLANAQCSNA